MSNPWVSPSGTPGRESPGLESTSSKSLLLQSIYGSQTSQLLNAMSSQLVIEEESEDDLSEGEYVPQTSKVSARPKSSPASAIAARQRLPRPQTATASSTVQRQTPTGSTSNIISSVMTACSTRRLSRPASAKPQLQSSSTGVRSRRPMSASVRSGYSSSNLASSSGMIKPTQTASQKKITRPKSAFVGSSMSVPMLDYDPVYEENVAATRAPLPTSGIVHRTDAPEYFNFWEGKPLSERGGMVIHERKQWKRPKSDYGSRYYTRTKSANSRKNSNNLAKVVEAWGDGDQQGGGKGDGGTDHGLTGQGDLMKDLLSGSDLNKGNNDDKYRNRDTSENDRNRKTYRSGAHSDSRYGKPVIEEEDEGIDDDYFQKSEDDKLPQVPSSTSITSSLSGTDLVNDISTTDLDRSPVAVVTNGYNSHVHNKENEGITIEKLPPIVTPKSIETPTTTIDSSDRMLCFNINSDDDDEYDKPISMDWLKVRLALTKHSTRFELPLELKRLEGLTPMEYLQMYCVISDRRAVHYSKIFNKFVKYPSQVLARVDLIPALIEVHFSSADKEQMECVLLVVDLPPEMKEITLRLFAGISALAERMLRQSTLPSTSVLSEYGQRREIVEDADFEALEWKLRGCTITDALRNLFAQL